MSSIANCPQRSFEIVYVSVGFQNKIVTCKVINDYNEARSTIIMFATSIPSLLGWYCLFNFVKRKYIAQTWKKVFFWQLIVEEVNSSPIHSFIHSGAGKVFLLLDPLPPASHGLRNMRNVRTDKPTHSQMHEKQNQGMDSGQIKLWPTENNKNTKNKTKKGNQWGRSFVGELGERNSSA